MVFNQKTRSKTILLTANSSKNAQGFCQAKKDSICYTLPQMSHMNLQISKKRKQFFIKIFFTILSERIS